MGPMGNGMRAVPSHSIPSHGTFPEGFPLESYSRRQAWKFALTLSNWALPTVFFFNFKFSNSLDAWNTNHTRFIIQVVFYFVLFDFARFLLQLPHDCEDQNITATFDKLNPGRYYNIYGYPYTSQKNISPKIICQKNISLNVLFPELTFSRNHTRQKEHLPEIASARMNTCQKLHLPEWTLVWNYFCRNEHLPECAFARMNICPKLHFPENLFSRIYTCQNVHLAEITFPRKLIFQNLHLPECTFGRNYISPKTYFPEFTLAWMLIWPKLHFPEN